MYSFPQFYFLHCFTRRDLVDERQDELEIRCRRSGQKGNYHGTTVLILNKTTGEVVAQGRHSLFAIPTATASKM